MKNEYTQESLSALTRKQLVKTAIASKAASTKAHSMKSAALITAILATQKSETPTTSVSEVVVENPAPATAAVETPVAVATETDDSNVTEFPGVDTEQTELPADPAPAAAPTSVSHGIFKVARKTFQRQLAAVSRLMDANARLPILATVLLKFGEGKLSVTGTDLNAHVETAVPAETTGEHSICIPFAVLSKFVSRCASEFLMAEVIDTNLHISDIENRTKIMGMLPAEFPPMHTFPGDPVIDVAGSQLARVITESIKCASTDESRFILCGVALDVSKNSAPAVVATDGRRLVRIDLGATYVAHATDRKVLIIPRDTAEILRTGIPFESKALISLSPTSDRMTVECPEAGEFRYRMVARLVDGMYPNYSQVIPKSETWSAVILNRAETIAALSRILTVAQGGAGKSKSNSVKLDFSGSTVTLSALNVDVGDGKEVLTGTGSTTKELRIAFNGEFIREVLTSWGDEQVTIRYNDEVSPIALEGAGKVAVVMPVRLS